MADVKTSEFNLSRQLSTAEIGLQFNHQDNQTKHKTEI